MTIASLADIKSAKTSELLAFYNAHRAPIVKFRDRTTAETRVADVLNSLPKQVASTPSPIAAAIMSPEVAPTPPKNPKTYVVWIRDHSGSMQGLTSAAQRDFNSTVGSVQRASTSNNIPTFGTVYECGGDIRRVEDITPIAQIRQINSYRAGGGTPLFKTVSRAMADLQRVSDYNDPEVTFIVLATTDGEDTNGGLSEMLQTMQTLNKTDRWTFAFRVPRGYGRALARHGILEGNILEWDQTERGVAASTQANEAAFTQAFSDRSRGIKSSKTFYSSLKDVTSAEVAAALKDVSGEVQLFPVSTVDEGKQIRDYIESRLGGKPMAKGAAFYQLVKTEDKIQDYKLIAVRDKTSNAIYCGDPARDMLGLPRFGDARVRPGDHGNFDVFIQSTSVNRKVNAGTQLMYWPNVGIAFKEGKSARP